MSDKENGREDSDILAAQANTSSASVPPSELAGSDETAGATGDDRAGSYPCTEQPPIGAPAPVQPPTWERIPAELRVRAQWLLAAPDSKGKLKVPTSVTTEGTPYPGSSTAPHCWLSFDRAVEHAQRLGYAIGYCFISDDPYTVIDLDVKNEVNEPEPGKWTTDIQHAGFARIVEDFDSYTERSQSGQGVHIWIKGKVGPGKRHREGVEVYSQERFMVCTGVVHRDMPIEERQDLLGLLIRKIEATRAQAVWTHLHELPERFSDEHVLAKARDAANGLKFQLLMDGRWDQVVGLQEKSASEADVALVAILGFYSRSNKQVRRLFMQSQLARRDKYQRPKSADYHLKRCLLLVRGRQEAEAAELAQVCVELFAPRPEGSAVTDTTAPIFTFEMMIAELVYVADGELVALRSNPHFILKAKEMRTFLLASTTTIKTMKGDKVVDVTHKTFDLWLNNSERDTVQTVSFDPSQGTIYTTDKGLRALNLWVEPTHPVPPEAARKEWVDIFTWHVAHLVPDHVEQKRFLQWLAHIVQRPGELPTTAYVLIAKHHGMGRGLLFKIMRAVLRGYAAVDLDLPKLLADQFTDEITQKLLITIAEIKEGEHHRGMFALSEKLKSFIDASVRWHNPKFRPRYSEKNCARLAICSNHVAALPIDKHDRRLIVLESTNPLPTKEHLEAVGGILRSPVAVASVWEHLRTLSLDGFNPFERAPYSSIKRAIIETSTPDADTRAEEMLASYTYEVVSSETFANEVFGANYQKADLNALKHIAERAGITQWKGNGRGKVRPMGKTGAQTSVWILRNVEHWLRQDTSTVTAALREQLGLAGR